jgi:hypothetical protein
LPYFVTGERISGWPAGADHGAGGGRSYGSRRY